MGYGDGEDALLRELPWKLVAVGGASGTGYTGVAVMNNGGERYRLR